jgi:hypothetical protein
MTGKDTELADKRKNQHRFLPFGLIFGAGIGLIIGMAADNVAVGLALGAGAGLLFSMIVGQIFENRDKP